MPQEVTEETRETLHVIELDRTPRPQKLAQERAFLDGAHEVRYSERTFRPRHTADLDEIRRFVDSLEIVRREVPALPRAPPPPPVSAARRIPEHYRAPLEAAIQGALLSVETVHRVGSGTVVDVAWESRDEGERRGIFVIENDAARPFDDVASAIDALPPPPTPRPAPTPSGAEPTEKEAPSAAAEKQPRKGFLGRFGKKPSAEPQPKLDPEPQPEPDQPKKRRAFFRGK